MDENGFKSKLWDKALDLDSTSFADLTIVYK